MSLRKSRGSLVRMNLYQDVAKPLLFRCDPEWIHHRTLDVGAALGALRPGRALLRALFAYRDDRLAVRVAGIDFANPIGLAAGFDKNGCAIRALSALGFGFVEIGSVSAHASDGNARPRLFRLPIDEAIVVNYGVPNDGAEAVARRINKQSTAAPLGVNIVETNTGRAPVADEVLAEFVAALWLFCARADYITLNLNCPNTTAGKSPFDDAGLLHALMQQYAEIEDIPPVFLKFTAHADGTRMEAMLSAVESFDFVKGFVFNLPTGKDYPLRSPAALTNSMPGTLCGAPTQMLLDEALAFWYRHIDRARHVLIGSGGVRTAADAYRKICLGASLVQVYTALVYQGPGLVQKINRGLVELLERDGFNSIVEAVGMENRPNNKTCEGHE
ncbi:MAG: quinone-dependent dihydroorotate dehydrogenase [Candidatus Latescibacterota bacterium]